MRSVIALAASMLASAPAFSQTLEESVASAMSNNPIIAQQYAKFSAFLKDKRAAEGEYYPSVNLYGAIGYEDTKYNSGDRVDEDLTRKELGVKAVQNLFNGFGTVSEVERLSFEAESERLTLISDAENLALDVTRVYLELLKAQAFLELTERNVADHEQVYKDIETRQKKGLSSRSDLAQISARVATSKSSLIAAKNNLMDKQVEFYKLVGRDAKELIEPKVDQALLPASEQDAITMALESHPEIKAAIADMDAAHKEMKREEADFYPKLNLEVHANHNDDIGGIPGKDQDARVMLTVSYDLYNGGATTARSEASSWRKQEARAIRMRTEQQVTEGTRLSWNAWELQYQQLALLQQNVDSAMQAQLGYIEQFDLGRRSLLDVLDAKVEVFLARKNYIDTYYNQRLASYRLLNATGRLGYSMRVAYPQQWQQKVISHE
ncbi:TolC family outer membrane protein [Motilimonas pumila]|uniref:Agglutination protein n=1 Tax=Motilimonas pumila TaxID=2303987 RepID=A0A418YFJ6_9GAMM|nr:TolC family outer membrane protein [Motilimonas pumila]RJG47964.1 agglutination protein [Motilimonas pumila]